MTLSIGILVVSMGILFLIGLAVSTYRKPKREEPKTANIQPVKPKTIQETLDEVLKNPPTGCMWEVSKEIKTYRRLPNGSYIFDGTQKILFANIKLITPFGKDDQFDLPVEENIVNFEKALRHNVKICLDNYAKEISVYENRQKQIYDDWDGLYR